MTFYLQLVYTYSGGLGSVIHITTRQAERSVFRTPVRATFFGPIQIGPEAHTATCTTWVQPYIHLPQVSAGLQQMEHALTTCLEAACTLYLPIQINRITSALDLSTSKNKLCNF